MTTVNWIVLILSSISIITCTGVIVINLREYGVPKIKIAIIATLILITPILLFLVALLIKGW